jgi:hypothetical protein
MNAAKKHIQQAKELKELKEMMRQILQLFGLEYTAPENLVRFIEAMMFGWMASTSALEEANVTVAQLQKQLEDTVDTMSELRERLAEVEAQRDFQRRKLQDMAVKLRIYLPEPAADEDIPF